LFFEINNHTIYFIIFVKIQYF